MDPFAVIIFGGVAAIERHQRLIAYAQNVIYGISLGSVLLLAAIGLAITFGVMGVINMAHGEMVMLGAYTTFVIQEFCRTSFPAGLEWSLIAALPAAFLVAGAVGVLIERGIIRLLYGRPLETLLARARGGYVATCEGDDYWIAPTKLQRQVAFLRGHADVSCSAHNYYHFVESTLAIKPWRPVRKDFFVSPRQLMAVQFLLWLPTLVFRKSFSTLPPERALAAFGDQFITSYLGTLGRGVYFETMVGAVRRENAFSTWSPLPEAEKERRRVRTWAALVRLHERLGNPQAVDDLMARIHGSALDASTKASILDASSSPTPSTLAAA